MKAASWGALAVAALFVGVFSAACREAPGDGRGAAARDTRGCPADLRRLLPGQPEAHGPSWSPDGRRIAFTASSGGRQALYVMAVSDCRIEPIRPRGGDVWFDFPDWSPDGRLLAFAGNSREPEEGGIFVMHPDGSGVRRVTRGPDLFPAWSPNGRRIAFVRALSIEEGAATDERNVWIVNADGSGLRQVTHGDWYGGADWSPDGERLVTDDGESEVFSVRADGSDRRVLVEGDHGEASWSPDGRTLLLAGPAVAPGKGGVPKFVGDVGGGEPEWSPNGEWIAFTDDVNTTDVWIVRRDGTRARQLTRSRKD